MRARERRGQRQLRAQRGCFPLVSPASPPGGQGQASPNGASAAVPGVASPPCSGDGAMRSRESLRLAASTRPCG
eukprot:13192300-Alexandrium_andersonii.AAC.1